MNVRPAKPEEAKQVLQWSQANADKNGFDPMVLLYPTTDILAVENGNGPVLYMPVQLVGMLESVAPSPEASPEAVSHALLAAVRHIVGIGEKRGARELYFLASDPALAEQAERAGFERCEWPAYKLRLGGPL
jgi:hypothetical protein